MAHARVALLLFALPTVFALPKPFPSVVFTVTKYTTICDTEVSSASPDVSLIDTSVAALKTTKAPATTALYAPVVTPSDSATYMVPASTTSLTIASAVVSSKTIVSILSTKATVPSLSTPPALPPMEPVSSPSSSGKRGLVMDVGSGEVVAAFGEYPKISWLMNWWNGPQSQMPSNWTFLPMLTHPTPDQYWDTNVQKAKDAGWPYLASLLEPDNNKVSVADAVISWNKYIEPYAKDFILVPPVVNDISWLQQFIAACEGCSLQNSPIAFNMYVSGDDAGIKFFKDHVASTAALFPNRDLWIPNAGLLGGSKGTDEYLMTNILPWLDQQEAIKRYAWNGPGGPTVEFWDGSELTAIGKLWATL